MSEEVYLEPEASNLDGAIEVPPALAVPSPLDTSLPPLRLVMVVWLAVATGLWLAGGRWPADHMLTFLAAGLTGNLVLCFPLSGRRPRLASALLVAGAIVTWTWVGARTGRPYLVSFSSVAVMAAGALIVPEAALVAGLAAAVLPLALGVSGEAVPWLALLSVMAGGTSWAALRPLQSLLRLTWQRSAEASQLTWELRHKQGELNRTIKALDLSYQLLEKTNRELAVAQREAVVLRDLRNRFATNLSHELRTPLNILLGFTDLIYHNPQFYGIEDWTDLLLRDLSQVQRNARYLSQLVDDVVDLARVDALVMPIQRRPTDMRALVTDAVNGVSSLAAGKGIAVHVSCPEQVPEVFVDPLRIRQTIYNLLSNAVRFTEHGEVRLAVEQQDECLEVIVSDTGRGIPESELSTIFDEFYQIGRAKVEPDSGKGLGLAIARRFVQLHGGRIWVESRVDQGSRFHFTLPFEPVTTGRLRQLGPSPVLSSPPRPQVLVIGQDDSAVPYLSRRIEGYDFIPCQGLDGGREALSTLNPSLILIDDGFGADLTRLRRELGSHWAPEVPVISCPLPSTRWLLGGGRFRAVLLKPVESRQLLESVEDVLAGVADRPRVLVVDDDRGFVQLVRRTFETAHKPYLLDSAYSGEEALRRARRSPPDCVLLDLVLPGMNGFDTADALKKQCRPADLPVIAITAATPGEDSLNADGSRFTFLKQGQFDPGELTSLLLRAMEIASGETHVDRG